MHKSQARKTYLGILGPLVQKPLRPTEQLEQPNQLRRLPLAEALQNRRIHLPGRLQPLRRREQLHDRRRRGGRRVEREQSHRLLELGQELGALFSAGRELCLRELEGFKDFTLPDELDELLLLEAEVERGVRVEDLPRKEGRGDVSELIIRSKYGERGREIILKTEVLV